jgi:hypothetical protein
MDAESFVEYYVLCEFFKPWDFSSYSTCYYFKDGRLYSGPLWDFDLAMGNANVNRNCVNAKVYFNLPGYGEEGAESGNSAEGIYCAENTHCPTHKWHRRLMEIPEFRAAVAEYYLEILPYLENLYQDNELGQNRIDRILSDCGDAFARNFSETAWRPDDVWFQDFMDQSPSPSYEENVERLRDWLEQRTAWLLREWCGE